jgi:hypothetical protein
MPTINMYTLRPLMLETPKVGERNNRLRRDTVNPWVYTSPRSRMFDAWDGVDLRVRQGSP